MGIRNISRPAFIAAAIGSAAVAVGLGGYVWREERRPPILEVYVFNLKNGRAVFVRTPEDKRILIDGGANADIVAELSAILPFYSRRIDTLIATDAEGKDVGGLIEVLDRYTVDRAYIPAVTPESLGLASTTDPAYAAFMQALEDKKVPVSGLSAGNRINFDSKVMADILFPILPPASASSSFAYSNASGPEVLMHITFGSQSILLLGNASRKVQKFIAASTSKANFLVVSQSALPTDMSAELIESTNPSYLVYSKPVTKAPKKKSAKTPTDPLASIALENRFNIREKGTALIVSDGTTTQIRTLR